MSHDRHRSLTEIALECGFGSSSDYSRSFKKRYGVPPSAVDLGTLRASNRARFSFPSATDAETPFSRVIRG